MTRPEMSLFPDVAVKPPAGADPILAATAWKSNAELVVALRDLAFLPIAGRILDPTFGRGTWWAKWRPAGLTGTDIATGADVRNLPFRDDAFDAAVYDPPHIPSYSLATTTADDFRDRFGLMELRNSAGIRDLYIEGIAELGRVIRPGGHLTVKTTDYINGRIYHPMAANAVGWLQAANFDVVDVLVMLRNPGPTGNRATHSSRRNYSTATVGRLRHRRARSR